MLKKFKDIRANNLTLQTFSKRLLEYHSNLKIEAYENLCLNQYPDLTDLQISENLRIEEIEYRNLTSSRHNRLNLSIPHAQVSSVLTKSVHFQEDSQIGQEHCPILFCLIARVKKFIPERIQKILKKSKKQTFSIKNSLKRQQRNIKRLKHFLLITTHHLQNDKPKTQLSRYFPLTIITPLPNAVPSSTIPSIFLPKSLNFLLSPSKILISL
ncbi:unnamed protein product [Moneuplotes crassus]|uniref:Uncharacterized protein n=1 Tax=Euplotes crassus TaxID=5936 RepID=A0AAD1Y9F4_EUPCR|nr:unnamed protein product [Moneuplotes crassus]